MSVAKSDLVLALSQSPQFGVMDLGRTVRAWLFDKNSESYPLLDVEDVFILGSVGSFFFLFAVPMQIQ